MTLGRSDLSRLLFEKIKGTTEVIFGDEIAGLRSNAGSCAGQFRRDGERRFDLVIGADGLHSNVRRLVFGPQDRVREAARLSSSPPSRPTAIVRATKTVYVMYGEPGRMLGRFALHDDRTLFLVRLRRRYCGPTGAARPAGAEGDAAREISATESGSARVFSMSWIARRSSISIASARSGWRLGRVVALALVGDAAFCVSLVAGQGSALAMTAAYVLAGELAKAQRRSRRGLCRYEGSCAPICTNSGAPSVSPPRLRQRPGGACSCAI